MTASRSPVELVSVFEHFSGSGYDLFYRMQRSHPRHTRWGLGDLRWGRHCRHRGHLHLLRGSQGVRSGELESKFLELLSIMLNLAELNLILAPVITYPII